MIPVSIEDNFFDFKQGALYILRLFKTLFCNSTNVILHSDNDLYINNLNRLVNEDFFLKNKGAFKFGADFVVNNIKNFRENLCVNPILYIIFLYEIILNSISVKDFDNYKYKFKECADFLKWYYNNSNLNKADVSLKDILKLLNIKDKFLLDVASLAYEGNNIEIIESKQNRIVKDSYYRLKARLVSGDFYKQRAKIYIVDNLNLETYNRLRKLQIPILVLCTSIDFEIETSSYYITIAEISKITLLTHYNDICLLTGYGRGYYNLNEWELNNYSFGNLKEFKITEGTLYFSVDAYLTADKVKDLYKQETLDRYYMLQGKNIAIYCKEEDFEKTRSLVSLCKSLFLNGIFYEEVRTLKLLLYKFNDNNNLRKMITKVLTSYLYIYVKNELEVDKILNNSDLKLSFDKNRENLVQEDLFTSLDYYLNTFVLLNSNIEVLRKLY